MLKEIDYKDLVENSYNPRKRFDDAEMVELTESIKKVGLLEPLVVRSLNKDKPPYEVICGIRRYKALGKINNGKKVPCSVVDVDDHQAIILSFTENYERSDFSPIEEARFFAKALNMDIPPIEGKTKDSQAVQSLSKEIPSSPATIERRLSLLFLPEKVQNMVEVKPKDGGLLLGAGELISRLREIENIEYREKKMIQLAKEYAGQEPNLEKLHDEIDTEIRLEQETREKEKEKRSQYEQEKDNREKELKEILEKTIKWYNESFEKKITKTEIENTNEILEKLQEKSTTLTTGDYFDKLTKKQISLEDKVKHLEMNYNLIRKEHLGKCPFCGGFVNASTVKETISNIEDQVDSLKKEQETVSKLKKTTEEHREKLRKAYLSWENICEILEELNGGEGAE